MALRIAARAAPRISMHDAYPLSFVIRSAGPRLRSDGRPVALGVGAVRIGLRVRLARLGITDGSRMVVADSRRGRGTRDDAATETVAELRGKSAVA